VNRDAPGPGAAGWAAEPADPDTAVAPGAGQPGREQAKVLAAVALGGAIGACARYGATLIWPTGAGAFPWTTFLVNVTGCAAMGILMVLITERFTLHRLTRPFVGTGVLGGYTTFSTATLDTQHLLDGGHPGTGLFYLLATLTGSVAAIWATTALTRLLVPSRAPAEGGLA
jgi:CrcB protein